MLSRWVVLTRKFVTKSLRMRICHIPSRDHLLSGGLYMLNTVDKLFELNAFLSSEILTAVLRLEYCRAWHRAVW